MKSQKVKYAALLIVGILLGWLIFGGSSANNSANIDEEHLHSEAEQQVWTCSMHPQIKQDAPGQCPLCGMDLIPMRSSSSGGEAVDLDAIMMSEEAMALANIQTTVVSRRNPIKEIKLYGTVQADERLSQSQATHVSGRIEKLFVNFTGETVRKGQTIATIYSPDLLNAQQELLEAAKMEELSPGLLEAAKEKLRLWKMSDEQITQIEKSEKVSPYSAIYANTSGVVVTKNVSQGDYVNQGSVLFDVANLSRIWVLFDAYEVDLPFLKVGDKLTYTLQAMPGETYEGKIAFIDATLDPTTRTAKVRVETPNTGMKLKPEMYASATIAAPLKQLSDQIVIPKTAVLWTGKRSLVYKKQPNTETPAFLMHEVELGPSLGDAYVIMSGINDGDEIVTNGAFTIDASAQLEGKLSMMNQDMPPATSAGSEHDEHDEHDGYEINDMQEMQTEIANKKNQKHAMITVQGSCEMCKDRIEKTAKAIDGVSSANWDLETKVLHLNFDASKTSTDAISKAVAKVGHDTDKYKAALDVYDALPGCCKYRD